MKQLKRYWAITLLLFGCAGTQRGCASGCASELGADWVIVQMDLNGRPFRCWALAGVSVGNESASDGIYWQERSGNLLHISGHYNRVQVTGGDWNAAYRELGLTQATCATIAGSQYDYDAGTYVSPNAPRPRNFTVTMEEPIIR
jgi:hypothetical protein